MDISKITDANELKVLAYDTMRRIEAEQNNLRLIETRLAQILAESTKASDK